MPNPNWKKGMPSANPHGRPKEVNREKKTEKALRSKGLMDLVRKLKPHQKIAVTTAVDILKSRESSESSKLSAARLLLRLYKDTLKEAYNKEYVDLGKDDPAYEAGAMRTRELLLLVGKLRPHLKSSVQVVSDFLKDSSEASDNAKLSAASLILQLQAELVKDVYHKDYVDGDSEAIQKEKAPVFSLTMVKRDK